MMLSTELLVTYGFKKVMTTPLEKWCSDNIVLFVETNGGYINFRVCDVNDLSITLYLRTESELQQILRIADKGGSIFSNVAQKANGDKRALLDRASLHEVLNNLKN